MEQLAQMTCTACQPGSPKVSDEELAQFRSQIPEWTVIERDGVKRLERVYTFKNFVDALAFTNKVGDLAEREEHHPALLLEWGRVGVSWWTHTIGGLHSNDLIMAAKTDQIYYQF